MWGDTDRSGKLDRWETKAIAEELFGPQQPVVVGLLNIVTGGDPVALKNTLEMAQKFW